MTSRSRALAGHLDGRVQRGARNREAIVAALLELVGEGELEPTAEQVAERACVGTRTVFRHFADMESLYAELSARVERDVRPLLAEPIEGTLAERARALVSRRVEIYERIAPFKRSGNVHRWQSDFLTRAHATMVRRLRAELLESLPELGSAPESVREAVDLVTSFEAWDRLRSDQHLGRERARAVLEGAALALLGSIGRHA